MKFFRNGKNYLSPEEKRKLKQDKVFAIISGILLGVAFPPFHFYSLMFVALVPLFFVWKQRSGLAELNRITYLFGFVFSLITLYWVGSWQPETDPFLMISGVAILFFNPILFLIPSTLFYFVKKLDNKRIYFLLIPFFWVTNEYVYSITDLKFPWLAFGHGLAFFKSYIQIAEFIGAHGLTLLVVLINVIIFFIIDDFRTTRKINFALTAITVLLIVLPIIYGTTRRNTFRLSENKVKLGLIQPNINPWNKWEGGRLSEQLEMYLSLSEETVKQGAEIVVWPETALPAYFLAGSYLSDVNKLRLFTKKKNISVLTGMPHAIFYTKPEEAPADAKQIKNSQTLYTSYNSVLLFDPNKYEVEQYGKIMLVPFGERVPFLEALPWLGDLLKWEVGISSWNVGHDTTVFKIPYNWKKTGLCDTLETAGVICIESIYADFAAQFVQRGAKLIAVVTNDSWYGDSSGPYQHKEISVLRAVENRRSVVRAANGGISCLIDPLGNTIAETKMYTRDALLVEANIQDELTFFTSHPLLVIRISYIISLLAVFAFIYFKIFKMIRKQEN